MSILLRRSNPTFVRPTPAYADESYVFLKLLQRLDYRQVVVVSVKGDRNGEQFVELFEKKRKKYKVHVSLCLLQFKSKKAHAYLIFVAASELTERNKVWMVNEDASKANNVPDGAIGSRLKVKLSALELVRNCILPPIRNGLAFLNSLNETINPPVECGKDPALSVWASDHGPRLLKVCANLILQIAICATSTSKITYNELCERISVDYDILNYNEGYREVGALGF
ncbi:hypothetical protein OSTOST_09857 [Ostertagia ostertagi]